MASTSCTTSVLPNLVSVSSILCTWHIGTDMLNMGLDEATQATEPEFPRFPYRGHLICITKTPQAEPRREADGRRRGAEV